MVSGGRLQGDDRFTWSPVSRPYDYLSIPSQRVSSLVLPPSQTSLFVFCRSSLEVERVLLSHGREIKTEETVSP